MTYVIDLDRFVVMSGQGGYEGTKALSNQTVLLLLSILDDAKRLNHWQGSGYELTDDDIDLIFEIVDNAIGELVT